MLYLFIKNKLIFLPKEQAHFKIITCQKCLEIIILYLLYHNPYIPDIFIRYVGCFFATEFTVHIDILAQFNQLHLRRHVTHRSHQVAEIFTADQSILILIKLFKRLTQLCSETQAHKYNRKRNNVERTGDLSARILHIHCLLQSIWLK